MSKITEKELDLLRSCQTEVQWNRACDSIKKARDGSYPSDWWDKVKLTGLMDNIMERWSDDSELKMSTFNNKSSMLKYLGIKDV